MAQKTANRTPTPVPVGGYVSAGGSGYYGLEAGGVRHGAYDQNQIKSTLANWVRVNPEEQFPLATRPPVEVSDDWSTGRSLASNSIPRGCFASQASKRYIEVWDQSIYNTAVHGAVNWSWTSNTSIDDTAATGGPAGFTDGFLTDGTGYCFAATTQSAFTIVADGTTTELTDGVLTGTIESHIPTPVFLDGYIFLAKQGSTYIYNSAVGDPTTWAATTRIRCESGYGNIVALARHKQSVVALCEDHIEFFKDGAIAAPNSPLVRQSEHTVRIGCINRATVASAGDVTIFAGRDSSGSSGIYMIQDYKVSKISEPGIDAFVSVAGGSGSTQQTGVITDWTLGDTTNSDISGYATGYIIPILGRPFYVLTGYFGHISRVSSTPVGAGQTLVYDLHAKVWSEFRSTQICSQAGSSSIYAGFPWPFACVMTIPVHGTSSSIKSGYVMLQPNRSIYLDAPMFLNPLAVSGTEEIDVGASKSSYVDNDMRNLIVTEYTDFGTPHRKFMGYLYPEFRGAHSQAAGVVLCLDNNSNSYAGQVSPPSIALDVFASSGKVVGNRVYIGGSFFTRQIIITTYGYGVQQPAYLYSLNADIAGGTV